MMLLHKLQGEILPSSRPLLLQNDIFRTGWRKKIGHLLQHVIDPHWPRQSWYVEYPIHSVTELSYLLLGYKDFLQIHTHNEKPSAGFGSPHPAQDSWKFLLWVCRDNYRVAVSHWGEQMERPGLQNDNYNHLVWTSVEDRLFCLPEWIFVWTKTKIASDRESPTTLVQLLK